jgi:hypothetical protein
VGILPEHADAEVWEWDEDEGVELWETVAVRTACDLGQSVRDFTGRPLTSRYDLLRRSDTFGPLLNSVFGLS